MSSMSTTSRERARFAVPDDLRADVRLLGGILGTIIQEDAGTTVYHDVERLRELAIIAHGADPMLAEVAAGEAEQLVAGWTWERAHEVARAFSCYFHLTNLAEERHRVRSLQERDREGRHSALARAQREAQILAGPEAAEHLLDDLEVRPVLTAHPTEARRRAVVSVTRRIAGLLAERQDPRVGRTVLTENLRRLHEEVDILWRTASLRTTVPTPLDEVRTAMAVFDDSLFQVLPALYRRLDEALFDGLGGDRPPRGAGVRPARVLGRWGPGREPQRHGRGELGRVGDPGRPRPARAGAGVPRGWAGG